MLHKQRKWTVEIVPSVEDLAEKLVDHCWCGCNGFKLGDYLFLNDSTGGDGAQEYGVVKAKDGKFVQVESITFGWCDRNKAEEYIRQAISGEWDNVDWASEIKPTIETAEQHGRCHLCA